MRNSFSSSSLHIMTLGPSMSLHAQAVQYLAQPSSLATSSATSALVIDARSLPADGANEWETAGAAPPTLKALLKDDGIGGKPRPNGPLEAALIGKPVPLAEPGALNGLAATELELTPNENERAEDGKALAAEELAATGVPNGLAATELELTPNENEGAEDDKALAAEELAATGVPNGLAATELEAKPSKPELAATGAPNEPVNMLPNPDALAALDEEAEGVPMGEPKTAWGDMAAREPEFGATPNPPAVRSPYARRMASSNNRMDSLTKGTPTLDAAQFSRAALHLSARA
jgi:hypothetical protein